MPNSTLPKKSPVSLLKQLEIDFPSIQFVASTRFSWHAGQKYIAYTEASLEDEKCTWALLHELGHALLEHRDYETDIELLQKEVAAWAKAHELAEKYGIKLDQNYIEDCTDSYRDWLHIRATCPTCYERSAQYDRHTYRCHNCNTSWHVTRSRLCRPYRKRKRSQHI